MSRPSGRAGASTEKDPISRLMTERHIRMEGGIQARSCTCKGPEAHGMMEPEGYGELTEERAQGRAWSGSQL